MKYKLLQLKITLRGVKPAVWRKILVEDSMTFLQLQKAIHVSFDWPVSKFSEFKVRGITVCQRQSHMDMIRECLGSVTTKLFVFNFAKGDKFQMKHDLVDDWNFDIEVDDSITSDMKNGFPICVDFHGKTPPIEFGSPREFAVYQHALRDKNHVAHEFYMHQYQTNFRKFEMNLSTINEKMLAV